MSSIAPASVQVMIRSADVSCNSAGDRSGFLLRAASVVNEAPHSSQALRRIERALGIGLVYHPRLLVLLRAARATSSTRDDARALERKQLAS